MQAADTATSCRKGHNRPFYLKALAAGLRTPLYGAGLVASGMAGTLFLVLSGKPHVGLACSFLGWVLALAYSFYAGWRLMTGRLPDTLLERYAPSLLLPPLLYGIGLSFGLAFIAPERGLLWGWMFLKPVVGGWGLFALGAVIGARKAAPAQAYRAGFVRMAGYVALSALIIGVNLHSIVSRTFYEPSDRSFPESEWLIAYWPADSGNILARPATPPSLRITSAYPRLGGDITLLPLFGAVSLAVYKNPHVDCASSNERLLYRMEQDFFSVAFVDMFSAHYLTAAEKTLGKLVLTPVAYDALVFFVHKDNPVTNLELEQLRAVYAGDIDHWNEVGGQDTALLAFQTGRPRTQQAFMELVMRGQRTASPLREVLMTHGWGSSVAEYRHRPDALGYGFLWQVGRELPADEIRVLSIDGVQPTAENIRSGRYPLSVPLVAAVKESEQQEARELLDWLRSPEGQDLIRRAGYVSLSGREETGTGH